MKFTELKNKSEAEAKGLLAELREKAHDISVKLKLNQHKNNQELKALKKDIARIMIFLSGKSAKGGSASDGK